MSIEQLVAPQADPLSWHPEDLDLQLDKVYREKVIPIKSINWGCSPDHFTPQERQRIWSMRGTKRGYATDLQDPDKASLVAMEVERALHEKTLPKGCYDALQATNLLPLVEAFILAYDQSATHQGFDDQLFSRIESQARYSHLHLYDQPQPKWREDEFFDPGLFTRTRLSAERSLH